MATKAELLAEAEAAGLEVDESMTKAEIQDALDAAGDPVGVPDDGEPTTHPKGKVTDAAGKEWEVPAPSPEVERGPLEGVPHDPDGTEYAALGEPNPRVVGEIDEDAELVHSPEVARGPLDATPAESIRHDNLA